MLALLLLNLFAAGILAGLEIGAHFGFHGPTLSLDEKPRIILRQGLVRKLRWLVPSFFIPTLLTGGLLTIFSSGWAQESLRLLAIVVLAIWVYYRVIGTVKINSASLEWDADHPPADWQEQVTNAEKFHIIGTWMTILAWICFLVSGLCF